MNTLFVPILFVCINSNCEFMQGTTIFQSEKQCVESIKAQKKHMNNLVKRVESGKIDLMEGTCVDVKVTKGLMVSGS